MKGKFLLVGGIVLLVALVGAGLAFAQGQTPDPNPYPGYGGMMSGYGYGMMGGYGYGMMGGSSYGPMHGEMLAAFAAELGLSEEQVQARLYEGETMWEIALAEGLTEEQVIDLMENAHDAALQAAVEAGVLTEEQAEWMDGHMEQVTSGGFAGSCHGTGANPSAAGRYRGGMWSR